MRWQKNTVQMTDSIRHMQWVYHLFHFHFFRLTILQYEFPYTTNLRLTKSEADAEGNMLFGAADAQKINDYISRVITEDELDPDVRRQVEDAGLFYQRVMQYRNQINHANDTSFSLQSCRILSLDVDHIQQTLQDVADFLMEIYPLKPNASADVKALPITKTIPT